MWGGGALSATQHTLPGRRFNCNCDRCDPGCGLCQASIGFGGALAPATNTTTPADPCSSFMEFAALTVPQLKEQLNAVLCANDTSGSVGFKFLGYALNTPTRMA